MNNLNSKDSEDLAFIMNNPEGTRFISRLLDYCGVHRPSYNPDVAIMGFNEGKRDVGLMLMSECHKIPDGDRMILMATRHRLALYEQDEEELLNARKQDIFDKTETRRRARGDRR